MLGMEHSFSHLAAISKGKNSLHPSCNILKLIGISNTAWQSLNMQQVARPKECVCSRVGAKRGSWGTAGELLGGKGKTVTQVVMVTWVVMGDQVTQEVESSVEKLDKLNEMQSTCETQDLKQ